MGPGVAAVTGFVVGAALCALVCLYLKLGSKSASVTNLTADCIPGFAIVRVQCSVAPDPGCTVSGVWAKVYGNPSTTPPDNVDSGASFFPGTGVFDFTLTTLLPNSDPDLVTVWPEFKATGAPVSRQFGPCTTSSSSSTTTSSTTTTSTSSTTTRAPVPPVHR